jgi:hypothetical protein
MLPEVFALAIFQLGSYIFDDFGLKLPIFLSNSWDYTHELLHPVLEI